MVLSLAISLAINFVLTPLYQFYCCLVYVRMHTSKNSISGDSFSYYTFQYFISIDAGRHCRCNTIVNRSSLPSGSAFSSTVSGGLMFVVVVHVASVYPNSFLIIDKLHSPITLRRYNCTNSCPLIASPMSPFVHSSGGLVRVWLYLASSMFMQERIDWLNG